VTEQRPEWTPAFPGQRPPFEPGHTVSLAHGARSPRVVDPLAAELLQSVLGNPDVSYLQAAAYRPALRAWSVAEARAQLFGDAIATHGQCDGCERCAYWDERLRKWQSAAAGHRARLGLDPLSRARLGRDVAAASVDTAALMAQLHQAEQEERR
jgi:hypothetical protein